MNKHFLAYKGKVFTNYDKENDGMLAGKGAQSETVIVTLDLLV